MSVNIHIPTPLRRFTSEQGEVEVEGATVGEALKDLTQQFPALQPHLYTEAGALRSFVNVFLNDEDVRYLQKEGTKIASGDTLSIIPSIAGGAVSLLETERELDDLPDLSPAEIRHYSRHLILPEIGTVGQRKLKAAKVLMIGTGGLGSPLGLYLAAAERLRDVNPHIKIIPHETRLDSSNALELFKDYDLIVDGTDNFPTRYLVNDACVLLGKPNVYGSIFRFEGQVSVFWGAKGPCYRCLFPEPPPPGLVPSCAEGGVLGVLPGIIGSLQANEVIKLVAGAGEPLIGRLVMFDALKLRFRELNLRKNPDCPICSDHPTQHELIDYEQFCGIHPEEERVEQAFEISAPELKSWLEEGRPVTVLDVRNPPEWEISRIEGAMLIPLSELQDRLGELDPADTIVAHCHHGMRSARAVNLLRQMGFARAINLAGGIDAWSQMVDPTIPRY